jgi:N-hydroxyarylamine O-acetyltransferase
VVGSDPQADSPRDRLQLTDQVEAGGLSQLRERTIMAGLPMSGRRASEAWVGRYLDLLGVDHAPPDLAALGRLTSAHLSAVPFENVTSILRRRAVGGGPVPPLDPEVLLAAWEQKRGGGLCFEVTDMLGRLLVALGYRAHPVLGFITFLGSHQAVLVELDGRRYLVDVGNGAPFFEPIPLDGPVEVRRAGLAYRFRPGEAVGEWVQDRWIGDAWEPFCRYELRPPEPDLRAAGYQRHHTLGDSWVVGTLTLIRCLGDEVCLLRDRDFTRFTPSGKQTAYVAEPAEAARLAAEVFRLPALPVEEGLRALSELYEAPLLPGPPPGG